MTTCELQYKCEWTMGGIHTPERAEGEDLKKMNAFAAEYKVLLDKKKELDELIEKLEEEITEYCEKTYLGMEVDIETEETIVNEYGTFMLDTDEECEDLDEPLDWDDDEKCERTKNYWKKGKLSSMYQSYIDANERGGYI